MGDEATGAFDTVQLMPPDKAASIQEQLRRYPFILPTISSGRTH